METSEKITIFLVVASGFTATFVFLVLATFIRRSYALRTLCFVGAIGGLVFQGGCYALLGDVAHDTGSQGDGKQLQGFLTIAALIAIFWSLAIVRFLPVKENTAADQKKEEPKNLRDDPKGGGSDWPLDKV